MNIQIQPVQGFGKTATSIEIGPFQIDVKAKSAKCRWLLRDEAGKELAAGATVIDGAAYAQWGADDDYAVDLVLEDAGVQRLSA